MFRRTVVAKVGLPKGVWEPLRFLHENMGNSIETLAEAFKVSNREMDAVLCAARLKYLTNPVDAGLNILERV